MIKNSILIALIGLFISCKEEKTEIVRNAVGSLGTCAVKELSDVTQ